MSVAAIDYINCSGHNKADLVKLITKQEPEGLDWIDLARDPIKGAVRIQPEDMDEVYQAVMKLKQNRRGCGEDSYNYYQPAITAIEQAYASRDFEAFKKGCNDILGKIGED